MGYIKHHTIIVSSLYDKFAIKAHKKAVKIFTKVLGEPGLVSPVIISNTNQTASFFIAPDGSKEGWETSQLGDDAREKFIAFLLKDSGCNFVEITFGGDDDYCKILNKG